MQGDIFALVINNLSPAHPCPISTRNPPLPPLPVPIVPPAQKDAQLQIPTLNRWFSHSPSPFSSFPTLLNSLSDSFFLFHGSGLSRRTLTLSPSPFFVSPPFPLSFSLSLSLMGLRSAHPRSPLSLRPIVLSSSFYLAPLSLDASGLSRCTRTGT